MSTEVAALRIAIASEDSHVVTDIFSAEVGDPTTLCLDEGVRVKFDIQPPSRSIFPLADGTLHLLFEIPSAVGAGIAANWLWHKIKGRKVKVLVERHELIVSSGDDIYRRIYEHWQKRDRGR